MYTDLLPSLFHVIGPIDRVFNLAGPIVGQYLFVGLIDRHNLVAWSH